VRSSPGNTIRAVSAVLLLVLSGTRAAAQRDVSGSEKIRLMLEEINNLGSVMMIAAHPDDENTALLAYLARGRHVRTAYLSLTRGEGGQNLIGKEQGPQLGILRTEELLAARKIDGAEQYFTRAIDFGFTKTSTEALTKWNREEVLGDVVWGIRRFRPDVIILRFSGTPRDGHGQHQASAILGKEAFSAAADPTRFPEQLKYVTPWQAKRLMTNLASFTAEQERENAKIPDKLEVDLGAYSPELGYSYNEIAGMSRSEHRSQAMGTPERKGALLNYLVTERGDKAVRDIFEGINIGWSRLEGGAEVESLLNAALASFLPSHPEALVPQLGKARAKMAAVAEASEDPLARRKLGELDELIALCAGVWAQAQSDKAQVTPGSELQVTLTAGRRSPLEVALLEAKVSGTKQSGAAQSATGDPSAKIWYPMLAFNKGFDMPVTVKIPESQPYTQPYWLENPPQDSMYRVSDPEKIGDPENAPVLTAEFHFKIAGLDIHLTRPVEHRYVDRVYGELVRPLAIVPPVGVEFGGMALVFPEKKPRRVEVPVKANAGRVGGELRLQAPAGWKVEPAVQQFSLSAADEQVVLGFDLTPPEGESQGTLRAVAKVGGREIAAATQVIDYPHIEAQTLFPPADAKVVRADIQNLARTVGYIMGAGDEVPEALRQMGAEVTLLSGDDLVHGELRRFDAIVTGVRAFNTRPDLRANYPRLFQYVADGGTLIVQYNTPDPGPNNTVVPNSTTLAHIGPYPIKTGRERVTVEDAPVTFPNPDLALLHKPNEITARDFEGWVQERGLNFASEWDPRYLSVLESHDPGEKPLLGGELYTQYGKGAYIFSSYDWFRELPAGVPGAYRLFANMLSAAKVQ
jgi:LmbE family N-acetylglucosaminyl deacetylase